MKVGLQYRLGTAGSKVQSVISAHSTTSSCVLIGGVFA